LRLHGDPARLAGEVQPALQGYLASLSESGWFWRVMVDTYQRETERYGGPHGIVLAEEIFHADSEAALALIERYAGEASGDLRWRLALRGSEGLLAAAGLTLPQRRDVLRRWLGLVPAGTGRTTNLHRLNDHYRAQRAAVETALGPASALPEELKDGAAILERRNERMLPVLTELRRLEREDQLIDTVGGLLGSFLHMSINRLIRDDSRGVETMIYDFLDRTYHAALARGKDLAHAG
jgi:lantibiotic biosynthesis protein